MASQPEGAVVVAAAGISEDDGKRHLAVAEIVADALAHGRRVGGVVDRVVDELESDAEIAAIGVERLFDRFVALGDHRRDPAGGGEQGRGLGGDDLEILVLDGFDPALGGELVDLALGDDRRGARQDAQHLEAAILDHQLEAAREEEIADQHAGRIAPDDVGGARPRLQARAVDDVVVEQGGGVDELDRGGELVVAGAAIIEQAGAGQGQHRPHPLAAAGDEMAGKLRDQGDVALHPIEDDGVDMVEVGRDQLDHRIERRAAAGERAEG